jgi:dTDP-4-amino-4,6-dideoxygalactose transaminase
MTEISFARPWLGEEEIQALADTVNSGWIMQGPRVEAFEAAFAGYVGVERARAVSSCTTGLHLALKAVGVRPGDVVVTVSCSFIATANAVRACSAEPVFVDIEAETLNMCPERLADCLSDDFEERDGELWFKQVERLTECVESPLRSAAEPWGRLGAVMVVHQVGTPANMGRILPLAAKHGIPVVEDAACALGSEITLDGGAVWEPVGKPHGEIACFSFAPRKVITTGEGGILTTRNPSYDNLFRLWREHGMTVSTANRDSSQRIAFESYATTSYNYRMTDLQAAIGLVQMERLPSIIENRLKIGGWYGDRLSKIGGIDPPATPAHARVNNQSYVARLADPARRNGVMQALKDGGIPTRPGITCIHREPPYADAWREGSLPKTEQARADRIILPLHPRMTEAEVKTVCKALARALV